MKNKSITKDINIMSYMIKSKAAHISLLSTDINFPLRNVENGFVESDSEYRK